jgi:hypothetical protein
MRREVDDADAHADAEVPDDLPRGMFSTATYVVPVHAQDSSK